jgi:hypothetical protein
MERGVAPRHTLHRVSLEDLDYLRLLCIYVCQHAGVTTGVDEFDQIVLIIVERSQSRF